MTLWIFLLFILQFGSTFSDTFLYTGTVQNYTVPANVYSLYVEVSDTERGYCSLGVGNNIYTTSKENINRINIVNSGNGETTITTSKPTLENIITLIIYFIIATIIVYNTINIFLVVILFKILNRSENLFSPKSDKPRIYE
jgi:hypothetical protein